MIKGLCYEEDLVFRLYDFPIPMNSLFNFVYRIEENTWQSGEYKYL